jgi:hypothetical protein
MSPVEILDGVLDERGSGAAQPDMYASIAEPSTNLTDTPSSTDIMALADELPAAQRVNVRATLDRILNKYDKDGNINRLLFGLEQLYTAVDNRIARERANRDRDRVRGFEPQKAVRVAQRVLQRNGVAVADNDLLQLFERNLIGDETEMSLRQIGRAVDKLVLQVGKRQSSRPEKPMLTVI